MHKPKEQFKRCPMAQALGEDTMSHALYFCTCSYISYFPFQAESDTVPLEFSIGNAHNDLPFNNFRKGPCRGQPRIPTCRAYTYVGIG